MTASMPTRLRHLLLTVVIVTQTGMFLAFLPKPPRVEADNVRYETAGYHLAHGEGLTLPYQLQHDPEVRAWACSRNQTWCDGENVPAVIYPPGYGLYIASVYTVAGRSLSTLVTSQLLLLLSMFWVFERIAATYLRRGGYVFSMAVAATYPFLARQAGYVMADHLHAALVLFGLALPLLRPAVWWRGLCCGLLLSAATLVRPYSFVCLPFVVLGLFWKSRKPNWRPDLMGLLVGLTLPLALWTARNEVVFGRFIPFSTTSIGVSLYYDKLEWTAGTTFDPTNIRANNDEINRVAGGDPFTVRGGQALTAAAFDWMKEHPWKVLASLPPRIARLWISLGTSGQGVSPAWPLLLAYLGGLLALGTSGMWTGRRRPDIFLIACFVLPYWAFLLHTPAEARRTLALRLPLLLCAGVAIDRMLATRPPTTRAAAARAWDPPDTT